MVLSAGMMAWLWLSAAAAVTVAPNPMVVASTPTPATSSLAGAIGVSEPAASHSRMYRATFTTGVWEGELMAHRVAHDGSSRRLLWNASAGIPEPELRRIHTIDQRGRGIAFLWNEMDAEARRAIGNIAVLRYIRGRALIPGFRQRVSLLGDIIHSAPAIAADQAFGYQILPGAAGDSYPAYVAAKRDQPDLVLVAANDGMLHAFDAATGVERFAYVPRHIFPWLRALTSPDYIHRYFVDGSPVVADAYLGGRWRTVVVTTLGRGGKAAFALDLSNPTAVDAASTVLWELSPPALTAGLGGALGMAMAAPAIGRTESGDWVALFGNGYNSTRGTAALVIVQLATGMVLDVLDTGVGNDNGLGAPLAIDRDRNGSIDTVYAGDLKGNLWKFDLSSDSASGWLIAYGGRPLFTALADNGVRQPVTARGDAMAHPLGGVLVVFGSGRFMAPSDASNVVEQSLYGIWDTQGARSDDDGDPVADRPVGAMARLVEQTVRLASAVAGHRVRVISQMVIDYGTGEGEQRGWVLDLNRPRERVLHAVQVVDGKLIMVSAIPGPNGVGGDAALWQLNPMTGSQFAIPVLDLDGDGDFDRGDGVSSADGGRTLYPGSVDLDLGLAGGVRIVEVADGHLVITITGSNLGVLRLRQKSFLRPGRASWMQRR